MSHNTKERTVLLRILFSLILLLQIILFITALGDIKKNIEIIDSYTINLKESLITPEMSISLDNEKIETEIDFNKYKDEFFQQEIFSYYDFVEFVVTAGKLRDVEVLNYQTDINTSSPTVTVTASGTTQALLTYIQFLETFEKRIPISRFTISRRDDERNYRMNFTAEYQTEGSVFKENTNE